MTRLPFLGILHEGPAERSTFSRGGRRILFLVMASNITPRWQHLKGSPIFRALSRYASPGLLDSTICMMACYFLTLFFLLLPAAESSKSGQIKLLLRLLVFAVVVAVVL